VVGSNDDATAVRMTCGGVYDDMEVVRMTRGRLTWLGQWKGDTWPNEELTCVTF
jgi:hypothetical protein